MKYAGTINTVFSGCYVYEYVIGELKCCLVSDNRTRNNKKWSRNKIVSEIIKLHNNCHSLRPSILRKKGSIKLLSAANYHFGSWRRAVETASLEYKLAGSELNKLIYRLFILRGYLI